jgi:hypothetical protein
MVIILNWPNNKQSARPTVGGLKWFHGSDRWRFGQEPGASSAWAVSPSGQAAKVVRLERKEVAA